MYVSTQATLALDGLEAIVSGIVSEVGSRA